MMSSSFITLGKDLAICFHFLFRSSSLRFLTDIRGERTVMFQRVIELIGGAKYLIIILTTVLRKTLAALLLWVNMWVFKLADWVKDFPHCSNEKRFFSSMYQHVFLQISSFCITPFHIDHIHETSLQYEWACASSDSKVEFKIYHTVYMCGESPHYESSSGCSVYQIE